ncbi:mannose-1-phosphate guanylyltransferase/mannose-6-phosphate isomerase [Methanococcoides burtonii]|uniref:mannose-1-phosphate guanylyltransferase n=1 Tax=Methanococcoides burtonii (strain DSM 6242 / NBRC 107633 / OCM 468 / ACE-M) TaxID=259564 RepID=Q12VK9_METBU|nr:Xanthan-like biosynthesis protein (Includes: Mannose-6-phosphate isomerase; Mannose-1-phosphate guanylyl transferase) [Methanococcoides burtonii DSM 6242]
MWPLSREYYPKQFLKLGKSSLFQDTFLRCLKLSECSDIFVVTNETQKFFVLGQIKELGYDLPVENVLIEPVGKNTLPAIFFGMHEINERFGKSIVGIFSSDHVLDADSMETIADASNLASDYLVTFGVVPSSPHTGYGYIHPGNDIGFGNEVLEFKEKPDGEIAKMYVKQGYLWNSGMFLFDTDIFFEEVRKYEPSMFDAFCGDEGVIRNIVSIYSSLPSISIDYGIMERSNKVAVVKLEHKWSDLGNFDAIYGESDKDDHSNAVYDCDSNFISSNGNLVYSKPDKIVSLIDINDMVVVDTPDALLVCPRKSSQKVKDVVNSLSVEGDERISLHQTVYRPWGTYTILESTERHKIKNITVMPQKKLSYQLHHHRSEHWVVVEGIACVQIEGKHFYLRQGESTFIRPGDKHRLLNPGKLPLEIIEVQLGESVDEDDIVRFDDEYGRVNDSSSVEDRI